MFSRFLLKDFHDPAPDPVDLPRGVHRKASNLARIWRVEVQRATSHQPIAFPRHHEIANVLGHLELRPRQHHTVGRIGVNYPQKGRNIRQQTFTNFQHGHATIRVPTCRPPSTCPIIPGIFPGAVRISPTPESNADEAASSLACIPPVATPFSISALAPARVNAGSTPPDASRTPS